METLLITKLTIKSYLQFISLKKTIQSKHYLQFLSILIAIFIIYIILNVI